MANFFTDMFKGKEPSIMTKEVVDPLKKDVATPLSKFLSSQVGQGLPRFPGQLSAPLPEGGERALSDFLALDAGEFFDKAVAEPETKRFKEEFLPVIREGFAGSLRGSGRFKAEEAGIGKFSEALAVQRLKAETTIPLQQFTLAAEYKRIQDIDFTREYNAWMRTLPQMNPALSQGLQFLQESTSTGTTILSAMDPGEKGWFWDLLSIAAVAVGGGSIDLTPEAGPVSMSDQNTSSNIREAQRGG